MITDQRKRVISNIAETLAQHHCIGNATNLHAILASERIPICRDDYEDAFEGMLYFSEGTFSLHVNNNTNVKDSKRERFTLAHEIGHYSLDEHRLGLKYGKLKPHGSRLTLSGRDPLELEADYFASCLLMPAKKFQGHAAKRKRFSLEAIQDLSDSFQASIVPTVIRFSEVGTHEIFAVFSRNNIVEWYARSNDFPDWPFQFKVHGTLPPTSVAGEFYRKPHTKYTGVEKVSPEDWFHPFKDDPRADRQMYEQCYYSDSYGYTISLVWFD